MSYNNPIMAGDYVFVSYSRLDYPTVTKIIQDLEKAGIATWFDQDGLKVGTPSWDRAIRQAIRNAKSVLFVASPSAGSSRYVRGELHIAEIYQCPVFPIWVDGTEWSECVPLGMIETQYTDARDERYGRALGEIISALTEKHQQQTKPQKHNIVSKPNFNRRNPYKGLRGFSIADKGDFFGRSDLIMELVDTLRQSYTSSARFLSIVGPSGAGKSSVVMAGLIPKLQSGALPSSDKWLYLEPVLPGPHPLESLAIVVADALGVGNLMILDDLISNSRSLHLYARRLAKPPYEKIVLVIDQLEELFTQTDDEIIRQQFIELIVTAVTESRGNMIVITTLRADFYDKPMKYPILGKLIETHSKSILPMNVQNLREVIEKPASLPDVQLEFDAGLVGDLLFDVIGQDGALPLLQFTLQKLVETRSGQTLTYESYNRLGGVRGALAKHAESIYKNLPSDIHKRMARDLFLRLIDVGQTGHEITRRRTPLSELVTPSLKGTQILTEIASTFTDARLLTTSTIGETAFITISHEALILAWERLANWVHEWREDVHYQHIINRDALEWIRHGKRPDDLYIGAKLEDAKRWAKRNSPNMNEIQFLEAAVKAEAERSRQSKREMRKQILEKEKLIQAHEYALSVEEDARKKLARDLHDGPVQAISAIVMRINIVKQMLKRKPEMVEEELDKIGQLASRTTQEIRHMLFTLRPLALESQGLGAALKQLCEKMQSTYKQAVSSNMEPIVEDLLTQDQSGTIFYFIEEAVNNARKYANASEIKITIEQRNHTIVVQIKDNGVGFDTGAVTASYESRGSLGMVNMRERAELLSGEFELSSSPGAGTTVTLTIPLSKEAIQTLKTRESTDGQSSETIDLDGAIPSNGLTILIVDDGKENREFIEEYILSPNGYQSLMAKDGQEGLEMAIQHRPDLILLDLQMPRLDGIGVLKQLKAQNIVIPVILMTFHGSEEISDVVFELGAKAYIKKPYTVDEMLDLIETHIQ